MSEYAEPTLGNDDVLVVELDLDRVMTVRAWVVFAGGELARTIAGYEVHPGVPPWCGEAGPGADNLSYSLLRACVAADRAERWWAWWAWCIVSRRAAPWRISVGEVRAMVRRAEMFFGERSRYRVMEVEELLSSVEGTETF